jgi:putative restriction endonuclease
MKSRAWTRNELIIAINLYCKTPFGRLHSKNPDVIEISKYLKRTPNALAMKLVNFASFDPVLKARSIKGLRNASKLDFEVWEEFQADWGQLAFESQKAFFRIKRMTTQIPIDEDQIDFSLNKTENERMTRVRVVQGFFHDMIMANYENRCSFCGINLTEVLNASHIIPWRIDEKRRADPRNGICLCSLHDRAFDRGLLSINNDYSILVSSNIKFKKVVPMHRVGFLEIEGSPMILPSRFRPDLNAITFHRNEIFDNGVSKGGI